MQCITCNEVKFLFSDVAKKINNDIICNSCMPTKYKCYCGKTISINSSYRHQYSKSHQDYLNRNTTHTSFKSLFNGLSD